NEVFTANDNPVVKTVYDPSPAGYCLPPGNAFTGFSTTGNNTRIASEFNVSGSWDKGWNFYCGLNKTGATTFFPASGNRSSSGAVVVIINYGFCWTTVYNQDAVWILYSSSEDVQPKQLYRKPWGVAVRPVQEF
ncbi:MAG: fimbrillin family protein, partial [Bacteroidales bacterium]